MFGVARATLAPDESVDPLSGVTSICVVCVSDELTFISVVAELDIPDYEGTADNPCAGVRVCFSLYKL